MSPTFNMEKFKELVLHVADRCSGDPAFGATKLNKILFFSDAFAYAIFGDPITGATYQKLGQGPAPRQLLPAQRELVAEHAAVVEERQRFNYVQKRTVALRPADLSGFSAEEIELVDDVIEQLMNRNASDVSALSHDVSVGWQIAETGQDIPYESIFLSTRKPTAEDFERGREVAAENDWLIEAA